MENKQPLLSICIPTKNRVDVLEQCLMSIITDKAYDPDIVEVVVSDNASTDNTHEFMIDFVKNHNGIVYNHNEENLCGQGGAGNFLKVLSIATGQFLKLCNDYSVFNEGGLQFLINTVEKYKDTKPMLYFSQVNGHQYVDMKSLDDLLLDQKWGMSWMGTNGYWKDDFEKLENKEISIPTRFAQLDWQLRTYNKERGCVKCVFGMTNRKPTKAKQGDYNFIEIHTTNFIGMFEPYEKTGDISQATMDEVRKSLLYNMIEWIVRLKIANRGRYSYSYDEAYSILYKNFGRFKWYKPLLRKYKIKAFVNVLWYDLVKYYLASVKKKLMLS